MDEGRVPYVPTLIGPGAGPALPSDEGVLLL